MRQSQVKIKDLETYKQCEETINLIEMDYDNIKGGQNAFFSGYTTELKEGAKKKIEMIERRMEAICKASPDYVEEGM